MMNEFVGDMNEFVMMVELNFSHWWPKNRQRYSFHQVMMRGMTFALVKSSNG